jgi:YegS/Rv2252/BmrU family lipid kinase
VKNVLIVNPAAGAGRCGREWPKIERRLIAAGIRYEISVTEKRGDATWLASTALRAGAERIIAVGGDGTANEVANGFFYPDGAEDTLISPDACLGYVALGTGQDLARNLALRGNPVDQLIAMLQPHAVARTIDLGRAGFAGVGGRETRRYFLIGADLGLGGETTAALEASTPWFRQAGGYAAYLAAAISAIVGHQPAPATITVDGEALDPARVNIVYVANGPFIGGGMRMAPEALLDDGLFDVIIARDVGKLGLLFQLLPAIYRGAHLNHPAVQHFRARRVRVETGARLLLQLDGEQPGRAPADFTIVPRSLKVLGA